MQGSGTQLTIMDDAFVAELRERLAFLEARWLDTANGDDVDAQAVLDALRAEVAELADP